MVHNTATVDSVHRLRRKLYTFRFRSAGRSLHKKSSTSFRFRAKDVTQDVVDETAEQKTSFRCRTKVSTINHQPPSMSFRFRAKEVSQDAVDKTGEQKTSFRMRTKEITINHDVVDETGEHRTSFRFRTEVINPRWHRFGFERKRYLKTSSTSGSRQLTFRIALFKQSLVTCMPLSKRAWITSPIFLWGSRPPLSLRACKSSDAASLRIDSRFLLALDLRLALSCWHFKAFAACVGCSILEYHKIQK
jgi:hypothetical protein